MTRVNELLNDNESVIAFDIDGVLAIMQWGDHNHFLALDKEWKDACDGKAIEYGEDKVSKTMLNFINNKDLNRMHVITRVYGDKEGELKRLFAKKYYGIPEENFYTVMENEEKVDILSKIKTKYPNVEDEKIIMIDDSTEVLNEIMKKSNYTTVHISSFLDM